MSGNTATYQIHDGGQRAGAPKQSRRQPVPGPWQPVTWAVRPAERLTPRQLEVLALMAAGRSNAAIARSLVISEVAVVQHTSHIYDRLELPPDDSLHRRVLAVMHYLSKAPAG